MEHMLAGCYGSVRNLVSLSVCEYVSIVTVKRAISEAHSSCQPRPAFILSSDINSTEEVLSLKRFVDRFHSYSALCHACVQTSSRVAQTKYRIAFAGVKI